MIKIFKFPFLKYSINKFKDDDNNIPGSNNNINFQLCNLFAQNLTSILKDNSSILKEFQKIIEDKDSQNQEEQQEKQEQEKQEKHNIQQLKLKLNVKHNKYLNNSNNLFSGLYSDSGFIEKTHASELNQEEKQRLFELLILNTNITTFDELEEKIREFLRKRMNKQFLEVYTPRKESLDQDWPYHDFVDSDNEEAQNRARASFFYEKIHNRMTDLMFRAHAIKMSVSSRETPKLMSLPQTQEVDPYVQRAELQLHNKLRTQYGISEWNLNSLPYPDENEMERKRYTVFIRTRGSRIPVPGFNTYPVTTSYREGMTVRQNQILADMLSTAPVIWGRMINWYYNTANPILDRRESVPQSNFHNYVPETLHQLNDAYRFRFNLDGTLDSDYYQQHIAKPVAKYIKVRQLVLQKTSNELINSISANPIYIKYLRGNTMDMDIDSLSNDLTFSEHNIQISKKQEIKENYNQYLDALDDLIINQSDSDMLQLINIFEQNVPLIGTLKISDLDLIIDEYKKRKKIEDEVTYITNVYLNIGSAALSNNRLLEKQEVLINLKKLQKDRKKYLQQIKIENLISFLEERFLKKARNEFDLLKITYKQSIIKDHLEKNKTTYEPLAKIYTEISEKLIIETNESIKQMHLDIFCTKFYNRLEYFKKAVRKLAHNNIFSTFTSEHLFCWVYNIPNLQETTKLALFQLNYLETLQFNYFDINYRNNFDLINQNYELNSCIKRDVDYLCSNLDKITKDKVLEALEISYNYNKNDNYGNKVPYQCFLQEETIPIETEIEVNASDILFQRFEEIPLNTLLGFLTQKQVENNFVEVRMEEFLRNGNCEITPLVLANANPEEIADKEFAEKLNKIDRNNIVGWDNGNEESRANFICSQIVNNSFRYFSGSDQLWGAFGNNDYLFRECAGRWETFTEEIIGLDKRFGYYTFLNIYMSRVKDVMRVVRNYQKKFPNYINLLPRPFYQPRFADLTKTYDQYHKNLEIGLYIDPSNRQLFLFSKLIRLEQLLKIEKHNLKLNTKLLDEKLQEYITFFETIKLDIYYQYYLHSKKKVAMDFLLDYDNLLKITGRPDDDQAPEHVWRFYLHDIQDIVFNVVKDTIDLQKLNKAHIPNTKEQIEKLKNIISIKNQITRGEQVLNKFTQEKDAVLWQLLGINYLLVQNITYYNRNDDSQFFAMLTEQLKNASDEKLLFHNNGKYISTDLSVNKFNFSNYLLEALNVNTDHTGFRNFSNQYNMLIEETNEILNNQHEQLKELNEFFLSLKDKFKFCSIFYHPVDNKLNEGENLIKLIANGTVDENFKLLWLSINEFYTKCDEVKLKLLTYKEEILKKTQEFNKIIFFERNIDLAVCPEVYDNQHKLLLYIKNFLKVYTEEIDNLLLIKPEEISKQIDALEKADHIDINSIQASIGDMMWGMSETLIAQGQVSETDADFFVNIINYEENLKKLVKLYVDLNQMTDKPLFILEYHDELYKRYKRYYNDSSKHCIQPFLEMKWMFCYILNLKNLSLPYVMELIENKVQPLAIDVNLKNEIKEAIRDKWVSTQIQIYDKFIEIIEPLSTDPYLDDQFTMCWSLINNYINGNSDNVLRDAVTYDGDDNNWSLFKYEEIVEFNRRFATISSDIIDNIVNTMNTVKEQYWIDFEKEILTIFCDKLNIKVEVVNEIESDTQLINSTTTTNRFDNIKTILLNKLYDTTNALFLKLIINPINNIYILIENIRVDIFRGFQLTQVVIPENNNLIGRTNLLIRSYDYYPTNLNLNLNRDYNLSLNQLQSNQLLFYKKSNIFNKFTFNTNVNTINNIIGLINYKELRNNYLNYKLSFECSFKNNKNELNCLDKNFDYSNLEISIKDNSVMKNLIFNKKINPFTLSLLKNEIKIDLYNQMYHRLNLMKELINTKKTVINSLTKPKFNNYSAKSYLDKINLSITELNESPQDTFSILNNYNIAKNVYSTSIRKLKSFTVSTNELPSLNQAYRLPIVLLRNLEDRCPRTFVNFFYNTNNAIRNFDFFCFYQDYKILDRVYNYFEDLCIFYIFLKMPSQNVDKNMYSYYKPLHKNIILKETNYFYNNLQECISNIIKNPAEIAGYSIYPFTKNYKILLFNFTNNIKDHLTQLVKKTSQFNSDFDKFIDGFNICSYVINLLSIFEIIITDKDVREWYGLAMNAPMVFYRLFYKNLGVPLIHADMQGPSSLVNDVTRIYRTFKFDTILIPNQIRKSYFHRRYTNIFSQYLWKKNSFDLKPMLMTYTPEQIQFSRGNIVNLDNSFNIKQSSLLETQNQGNIYLSAYKVEILQNQMNKTLNFILESIKNVTNSIFNLNEPTSKLINLTKLFFIDSKYWNSGIIVWHIQNNKLFCEMFTSNYTVFYKLPISAGTVDAPTTIELINLEHLGALTKFDYDIYEDLQRDIFYPMVKSNKQYFSTQHEKYDLYKEFYKYKKIKALKQIHLIKSSDYNFKIPKIKYIKFELFKKIRRFKIDEYKNPHLYSNQQKLIKEIYRPDPYIFTLDNATIIQGINEEGLDYKLFHPFSGSLPSLIRQNKHITSLVNDFIKKLDQTQPLDLPQMEQTKNKLIDLKIKEFNLIKPNILSEIYNTVSDLLKNNNYSWIAFHEYREELIRTQTNSIPGGIIINLCSSFIQGCILTFVLLAADFHRAPNKLTASWLFSWKVLFICFLLSLGSYVVIDITGFDVLVELLKKSEFSLGIQKVPQNVIVPLPLNCTLDDFDAETFRTPFFSHKQSTWHYKKFISIFDCFFSIEEEDVIYIKSKAAH